MYAGRNRRLGFLYVLPALLFVLAFTAYPFVQMVWMSLHSWSLIKPPKFIGLNNFRGCLRTTSSGGRSGSRSSTRCSSRPS